MKGIEFTPSGKQVEMNALDCDDCEFTLLFELSENGKHIIVTEADSGEYRARIKIKRARRMLEMIAAIEFSRREPQ